VVAALGETQDKESLGGSIIHTRNGVIDDEAEDEAEAFVMAKQFLSYLPSYVGADLERLETQDPVDRAEEHLLSIVPRDKSKAYNMRRILESVADIDSVFEMGRRWGRGTITAFARFDGWPVAMLASDPTFLGGSWTAETAEKAKRFTALAEQFGMPVIHLVDNPGFMIGRDAERTATIRRGVEAIVAYQSELQASDNPTEKLAEIKERLRKVTSPFRTAEHFAVEDIIDPRATRKLLCEFVTLAMR